MGETGKELMSQEERVAAIDCGTNSIRLLIADVPRGGNAGARDLVDLEREMVITRLGQGVDKTGSLHPHAIARTLAAAAAFQERIEAFNVSTVRIAATSATRDAANREEFVRGVKEITGVEPEVITGKEEARLSFQGAISSLPDTLKSPYLVVDIGGGSTEFVLGTDKVLQAVSIDMGSVRVTERFGPEPWNREKLVEARTWIDARIREANTQVDLCAAKTVVGVAGTITTLAGWSAGVQCYSPDITHGFTPTPEQWEDALTFMIEASTEEKAAYPAMPSGRADVIGGGALIWERILTYLRVLNPDALVAPFGYPEDSSSLRNSDALITLPVVVVSEHDILDGLALSQVTY